MAKRVAKALCLLATAFTVACASAPDPRFGEDPPNDVLLVLVNDYRSAATAHLQWLRGGTQPLGVVPAGESLTVRVPIRGAELRVFYTSPGRSAGDPEEPGYLAIRAGDRMEWRLQADRYVLARRLDE